MDAASCVTISVKQLGLQGTGLPATVLRAMRPGRGRCVGEATSMFYQCNMCPFPVARPYVVLFFFSETIRLAGLFLSDFTSGFVWSIDLANRSRSFNAGFSYPTTFYSSYCSNDLYVPRANIELYNESFLYNGPRLWNTPPDSLKVLPELRSFKCSF